MESIAMQIVEWYCIHSEIFKLWSRELGCLHASDSSVSILGWLASRLRQDQGKIKSAKSFVWDQQAKFITRGGREGDDYLVGDLHFICSGWSSVGSSIGWSTVD